MRHRLFDLGREYTRALDGAVEHRVTRSLPTGYIPQDGPVTLVQVQTRRRGGHTRADRVATDCTATFSTVAAGSTAALEAALDVHEAALQLTSLGAHRLSAPRELQDPAVIGDASVPGAAQAVSTITFTLY